MNYLVHFLLAGDDDELRLGNLLGDFVKGPVERFAHSGLTDRLRVGIQMHRTIDAFSDRHPAVHRSKRIGAPLGIGSGAQVCLVQIRRTECQRRKLRGSYRAAAARILA